MKPFNFINFQLYKLLALMLTFNFQLLTFNCFAQANQPGAGNALSFDGVDDYVDVPDNANWNFGAADFTISLWVSFNDIIDQTQGFLLHAADGNSGSNGWAFVQNSDGINFYTGTSGGMNGIFGAGSWNPPLNIWTHLAIVRNGNNWTIYQDGVSIRTATVAVTIGNGNTSLKIAKGITYTSTNIWTGSASFFANAKIDEVRIWNKALTQNEIRDNMCKKLIGNEAGLVGYWRFDETTGIIAFDSSPNGNNGTGF